MTLYAMNQFRAGLKVMMDNQPCNILSNDFVKPGKGQAFVRVKFRNLKTGRTLERTFKASDTLSSADVLEIEMQYLYHDGELWHFMDPNSYEQYGISKETLSDAALWLTKEALCIITLWNNQPISVTPPNFVTLKVTETDPGVRGDTATGGTKRATLETGAVVQVPLFLEQHELIKVDTRTGAYVSRVKSN